MSFSRYPEYKDSGVEWLGRVPTHWNTARLSSLARSEAGSFVDGDWIEAPFITDNGIRLLQTGNVGVGAFKEQGFRYISEATFDKLRCTEVSPGDLLICRLADPVGRACIAPDLGCKLVTSVDVCILKTRPDLVPSYVIYLLSSAHYLGFMEGQCRGGTRDRVSRSFLGAVRVCVPPFMEQKIIAGFLDCETAKIDGLVAEQERLIDLLKEKHQAVISHAVIRGLNTNAPMRPSGIEWLTEIPSHWRVVQVKHLAKQEPKAFTDGDWIEAPYITTEGVRLIQTGNIGIGVYKEQGFRYISEAAFDELGCTEVKPRDILVCRLDGPVGRACLAPDLGGRMVTSVDNAVLKVGADVHPEFFVALFSSVPWISWIDALCRVGGGFRLRISRSQLGELRVPFPPYKEQVAIANHLAAEAARADPLISQAERAIDLLQERRSALISAVVTGQIDVRSTALSAPIPDPKKPSRPERKRTTPEKST